MRRLIPLLTSIALASTGCAHTTQPAAAPVTTTAAQVPSAQADVSAKASTSPPAKDDKGAKDEKQAKDDKPAKDEGMWREWGWISVGVGATAAVVALGTSYVMLHYNSIRNSNCNDAKVCSQSGSDANYEIRDIAAVNVTTWAIAAVGLGVGAFLVLTHPRKDGSGTTVGVSPNGSGGSFTLRSTF
jgi:hypothetical protein